MDELQSKINEFIEEWWFGKENYDYVICKECHQKMKQIQYRHLLYKHNMSVEIYLKKYPNSMLIAERFKNTKESGKNPMDILENREKIKKSLRGRNVGFGSTGHKCKHVNSS